MRGRDLRQWVSELNEEALFADGAGARANED